MLELLRASLEDATAIAQCTRDAYADEILRFSGTSDIDKVNGRLTVDAVQNDIKNHIYYKIVLDGVIIGGVFLYEVDAQTLDIEDFCIIPIHHNKGYGKFVLSELERIHSGIKKWVLTTPVYSVRNQHLYEKHGYKRMKIDDYGGILCVFYEKYLL